MAVANKEDATVRQAAFAWLKQQVNQAQTEVLPRALLAEGFYYHGQRVPLLGPQGIFKPALLDIPLSITTIPNGPYDDSYSTNGLLRYRYRGTDVQHRDNRGLRQAMRSRIPLVYFYQVLKGRYMAIWPVFIVADDPASLTFTVEMDDAGFTSLGKPEAWQVLSVQEDVRRSFITATRAN